MKMKAFSVFDLKACAFLPPFYFNSAGQAVRAFSDTVNDPKSQLSRHPADFVLFEVGAFDDSNGAFECVPHVNLGTAVSFLEPAAPTLFGDHHPVKES